MPSAWLQFRQHIFNPSNLGVAVTLVLFPEVGFAPPYHFTENITGLWDWGVPLIVLMTGIIVHGLFTGRLPLVGAWVGGFILQGLVRAKLFGSPLFVPLMPMTSAAFIVFTLYMIPDPATTPLKPSRQVLFGFSVAIIYALSQILHIVFGLSLRCWPCVPSADCRCMSGLCGASSKGIQPARNQNQTVLQRICPPHKRGDSIYPLYS